MGNNKKRPGQRMFFGYSYGEHDWVPPATAHDDEADDEAAKREFVRDLGAQQWHQIDPAREHLLPDPDPDIRSFADLAAIVRENVGDETAEFPLEKLTALMDRSGWSFVGGSFTAFEGHHNDTSILVLLEQAAVTFSKKWRSDTVRALARRIDESHDFTAMPILADALQDAGCDNADLLDHCRGPGPHVRGCWVVNLALDKQ